MQRLKQLREKIEKTDAVIIKKLAQRQKLSKQIGQLKAQVGKKVLDVTREKQLMDHYEQLSTQYDLQPKFIKQLFKTIILHSRRLQKK